MRRPLVLSLVLFAMFWQTLAFAHAGSAVHALADMEHTALHWQKQAHHHHEDGSVHLDDSFESVQHALGEHLGSSAALPESASHHFPPSGSAAPVGLNRATVPEPDAEGLLRPPRSHS